ncbi:hypothetical protein BN7_297 [Wickerhamomyces ciferrii]|uniref:Cullin family profile domain-containing protein n=1 Tax=Wickerhamomyces ciferrii (strain ATCC 14091 / BCRC 22168 / CBS 111 / JCM 3599 / NBRC 0793 / NRRL Y-1031 F-60-10) TaxID=1206466 RepID=K0KI04_WICCF|nr:uncharacterized protein BN7_297 [Wickerhamomyces ciferrii]CCH40763.1 hypothetical protein BN7_297 [Wickerhamomyces ciferrii]
MLSNGSRKKKIRAPRKVMDFEKSWAVLAAAIREIENKNAYELSFEELYRKSYNLVLRKYGKQLYESVKLLIGDYLLGLKDHLNKEYDLTNDNKLDYLKDIKDKWEDHILAMRMISDVLMYLDRVYAKENHLPLIYDVGINLFRDNLIKFNSNTIGNQLNMLIMDEITSNRNGLIIDIFLIKSIINMFESLIEDEKNIELGENYYLKYFEPFYLNKTFEYYEKQSNEILDLQNGTIYLKMINELIINEENKSILYLPNITYPKLIKLIDEILISSKIDQVMKFNNEGLKNWILNEKYDDLNLLYKLLSRVDYFDGFKLQINEIILEEGSSLESNDIVETIPGDGNNKNNKNSSKKATTSQALLWIEKIIKLKDKYDLILKSLNNDLNLQKTIENSFVEFLNKNSKLSEYLSLFIDDLIKKSGNKSEEEIEIILNKSIIIFRFIKDKDLFEKYYKNHLAKRLLKNSNDLERVVIAKIKNEIGSSFTSKLEGMFRDINLSKEVSKKFNSKIFEINVLTKTFWPIQPTTNNEEIILPQQLESLKRKFNDYYLNLYNGRNLNWSFNFGSIDIRIKFDKKIHELNMSIYCGIIVLLFEENDELTFSQIETLTQIPKSDLIRSLQSIAVAPRTRILTKKPMSKDIKPNDLFKFNNSFSSPMTKVKILTVANKIENDSERNKTMEKIDEDRKFELDAAIVRIMKSRKTLRHNELIVETVKQITRFKPSPQFIKKRIEALLEREYLQRDKDDRGIYHYLA